METSPGVLCVPDPLQGSWDVKRLQAAGRGRTNQDPHFQAQPLPHPQVGSSDRCCPEQKGAKQSGSRHAILRPEARLPHGPQITEGKSIVLEPQRPRSKCHSLPGRPGSWARDRPL